MKFIKLFEEQTAINKAKNTLNRPNVSLIKTNRKVYSLTEEGGEYEYVDLGLPSRLKWAKCNIGAATETEYGNYFMWGSITPNTADECTWTNAPFNGGSSNYDETKFNPVKGTVCPNGVLAKEYDAASQIMGGDWRMPTKAEIQELIVNTTNEWVTNYKGPGVSGWKFTGSNGNSIFIPAAGYCSSGSDYYADNISYVWSSSINTSDSALAWNFNGDLVSADAISNPRSNGLAVRGVL